MAAWVPGAEDHTKFQESIYFRSVDGSTLYVNLYMASMLNWPERGFTIEQSTAYPEDPAGSVTLTVHGAGRLDIKLRVPCWVEKGWSSASTRTSRCPAISRMRSRPLLRR